MDTLNPLRFALQDFDGTLNASQRIELRLLSTRPDAISVLKFTAEMDDKNTARDQRGISGRCFAFLDSVHQFSSVVDTFVQSYPGLPGLIWGSVKITLLIASNGIGYFDKLTEYFMRLQNVCPRLSEYGSLYQEVPRLQSAITEYFATVVRFCSATVTRSQRTSLRNLALTVLSPRETDFGRFEIELRHRYHEVNEEVTLAAQQAFHKDRHLQEAHRQQSMLHLLALSDNTNMKEKRHKELQLKDRRRRLLCNLSEYDYNAALKKARRKRHRTTAQWLLGITEFQTWKSNTESSLFVLSGHLGSGKTILAASVIDYIHGLDPERFSPMIGFFFCRFDDQHSLQAETILRSLLRQVLQTTDAYQAVLKDIVNRDGAIDSQLLLKNIQHAFVRALNTDGLKFIVIDGVDDCEAQTRNALFTTLRLLLKSCKHLKVFISARDKTQLGSLNDLPYHHCRTIGSRELEQDIVNYVDDTIRERRESKELIVGDESIIPLIRDALVSGSQGMFLWAVFLLDEICHQSTDNDIKRTLQNLPGSLDETYQRILDHRIPKEQMSLVHTVFEWISVAKRPLKIGELQEVLAIQPGDRVLRTDRMPNGFCRVASWCGGLITVDEGTSQVQFAHHSVKQFLLENARSINQRVERDTTQKGLFDIRTVEHTIAEICITYLTLDAVRSTFTPDALPPGKMGLPFNELVKVTTSSILVMIRPWTAAEWAVRDKKILTWFIEQHHSAVMSLWFSAAISPRLSGLKTSVRQNGTSQQPTTVGIRFVHRLLDLFEAAYLDKDMDIDLNKSLKKLTLTNGQHDDWYWAFKALVHLAIPSGSQKELVSTIPFGHDVRTRFGLFVRILASVSLLGRTDIVRLLNFADLDGWILPFFAFEQDVPDALRDWCHTILLGMIKYKVNLTFSVSQMGNTPAHVIARTGNARLFRLFLRRAGKFTGSVTGPAVITSMQNHQGDTLLHVAAIKGHSEIFRECVKETRPYI
ncbi:hypothetical protein MMC25_003461 [Agyrium rufum]|nr:hypothetical protein [Agyrium rufum]